MKYHEKSYSCLHCHSPIEERVYNYSTERYKYPLCYSCQIWYRKKPNNTTRETIELYLSLKERGVSAKLEKCDGYKTIDIAVDNAKLYIEVDGPFHNDNHEQALLDLRRTFYSFQQGYFTLRIPNILIKRKLKKTTDYITQFLKYSEVRLRRAI